MGAAQRKYWTVLHTEHKSEGLAARSLLGIVLETYNPLFRLKRSPRGVRRILPVLMGYLLVRIDRRATVLGEVARAKGVKSIMRGADGGDTAAPPCIVQDSVISWIRGLEDDKGYVRGEKAGNPPAFAFGDHVLALSGAFREQSGVYCGLDDEDQNRATIQFEILGRVVESTIPRHDLALV